MFRLDQESCKLSSVSPRNEFHGDDHKLACSLKFTATLANTVLNQFDEGLRPLLFKRPAKEDQDLADQGSDDDDYLAALRFPEMGKIKWDYEGAGYRMVIAYGVTGKEDIILINAEVNKFAFDCKQGGSVELEFNVNGHPTEAEMGKLCSLLQSDVDLTLEPPSPEQRAQMAIDAAGEDDEKEGYEDDAA